MANSDERPVMEPFPDKTGTGWHVVIRYREGHERLIEGFASKAEAVDWIEANAGQVKEYRAVPRGGSCSYCRFAHAGGACDIRRRVRIASSCRRDPQANRQLKCLRRTLPNVSRFG